MAHAEGVEEAPVLEQLDRLFARLDEAQKDIQVLKEQLAKMEYTVYRGTRIVARQDVPRPGR